jgi:large subunit ribosomal protein L30
MAKELHVTQTRSVIKSGTMMERTVRALGLTRIRQTVVHDDNPVIRGMIDKVKHLISVKEVG